MGDVGPADIQVQKLRLLRQRKQVELNVSDCELRLAELGQEQLSLKENIKASEVALKEMDEQIAELGSSKGDE